MPKQNKLFAALEVNMKASSNAALIKTIVANPEHTIGYIFDSLGEQDEARYLLEAFKDIQIGEIVQGAIEFAQAMQAAHEAPEPEAPAPVAEAPAATPRNAPTRKAAPIRPRLSAAPKTESKALDLSTPDKLKAYEAAILQALRDGKHVDEDSGISNAHLRKIVGGNTDQCRGVLNVLIESQRAGFYGQARGTKYYRF